MFQSPCSGRRVFSWLSGQQQFVTDSDSRGCRRSNAVDRYRRCSRRCSTTVAGTANLLKHLPSAALAAVVIASAIGLFEVAHLRRIFRIQSWEFWLSIVCFVGVAVLGAIPGIGFSVAIAIIEFLWDGWRPHSAVLVVPRELRVTTTSPAIPMRVRFLLAWFFFVGMLPYFSQMPRHSPLVRDRRTAVAAIGKQRIENVPFRVC